MRKITILIALFLLTFNISFGQKYLKLYDKGVEFFNQREYKKADSMFTLALDKQEHKDIYYDRGITKLMLSDTCSFCKNMKAAFGLADGQAKKMYKSYCIKYNSEAYKLYLNGSKEFLKKNYMKSDSILSLSIDSYAYIDNVSLRGLVKLYQKDTVGFCKDMKSIRFYDENANNNYCNFCMDTIYYDKSFLRITDKSDYFEINEKLGCGFVYDLTKSDLAIALYNYYDTLKAYECMDNRQRNFRTQMILEYINGKVYIPKEIKQLLRSANIIEFNMVLICIASEKGKIIYCKNGSTESPIDKTKLTKEEKEKIKNTLFEIAKNAALNAPIAEPVKIGNKKVIAQYALIIDF